MKKTKQVDSRKFGKVTGCVYDFDEATRRAQISPYLRSEIDKIIEEEAGLNKYAASVHEFMTRQHQAIHARSAAWWKRIAEDIPEFTEDERGNLFYDNRGVVFAKKKGEPQ